VSPPSPDLSLAASYGTEDGRSPLVKQSDDSTGVEERQSQAGCCRRRWSWSDLCRVSCGVVVIVLIIVVIVDSLTSSSLMNWFETFLAWLHA
jgi:hypothetical protein